jgi:hypothetical protein
VSEILDIIEAESKAAAKPEEVCDDADAFFAELEQQFGKRHVVRVELTPDKVLEFEIPQSASGIGKLHREAEAFSKRLHTSAKGVIELAKPLEPEIRYAAFVMSATILAPKLKLRHFLQMATTQGIVFLGTWSSVQSSLAGATGEQVREVEEGKDS